MIAGAAGLLPPELFTLAPVEAAVLPLPLDAAPVVFSFLLVEPLDPLDEFCCFILVVVVVVVVVEDVVLVVFRV